MLLRRYPLYSCFTLNITTRPHIHDIFCNLIRTSGINYRVLIFGRQSPLFLSHFFLASRSTRIGSSRTVRSGTNRLRASARNGCDEWLPPCPSGTAQKLSTFNATRTRRPLKSLQQYRPLVFHFPFQRGNQENKITQRTFISCYATRVLYVYIYLVAHFPFLPATETRPTLDCRRASLHAHLSQFPRSARAPTSASAWQRG